MPKPDASRRRRRWPARLCRLLGTLLLLGVMAVCLPLSLPRLFGYQVYAIVSASMEPAIPTGSVVFVQTVTAPQELTAGTVIAFVRDGTTVVHRVVENRTVEGEFVTQGDANAEPDALTVAYSEVVGTVAGHLPLVGLYAGALSTWTGKLYALGFVVAAAMLYLLAAELNAPPGKEQ